ASRTGALLPVAADTSTTISNSRPAYAVMLRSPHAHAQIRAVDTAAASSAPGVLAVYTGEDLVRDGRRDSYVDDTPVPVLAQGTGKTKTGRAASPGSRAGFLSAVTAGSGRFR